MGVSVAKTSVGIKRNLIGVGQSLCQRMGFVIRKANGYYESCFDVGRDFSDPEGTFPRFVLKSQPPTPWAGHITLFEIDNGQSIHKEVIYYSHLTLLKMCKEHAFRSVLDIGSHEGRCARIFKHIGKEVTTVEIAPEYEADYHGDYLAQKFDRKFEAIWCSQTYEHQRNPGLFLDKIFDDLEEGGVLGLTVPFQIDHNVMFGHLNIPSPLMLIYHLVCAGFDCSEIALKCYNSNIGVVLKKKYNGILRYKSMGSIPLLPSMDVKTRAILGDELFDKMIESFPPALQDEVRSNFLGSKIVSINWDGML